MPRRAAAARPIGKRTADHVTAENLCSPHISVSVSRTFNDGMEHDDVFHLSSLLSVSLLRLPAAPPGFRCLWHIMAGCVCAGPAPCWRRRGRSTGSKEEERGAGGHRKAVMTLKEKWKVGDAVAPVSVTVGLPRARTDPRACWRQGAEWRNQGFHSGWFPGSGPVETPRISWSATTL